MVGYGGFLERRDLMTIRHLAVLFVFAIAPFIACGSDTSGPSSVPAQPLQLSPSEVTLQLGQSAYFTVTGGNEPLTFHVIGLLYGVSSGVLYEIPNTIKWERIYPSQIKLTFFDASLSPSRHAMLEVWDYGTSPTVVSASVYLEY